MCILSGTDHLASVPGVEMLRCLHVWSLGPGKHALACHVKIAAPPADAAPPSDWTLDAYPAGFPATLAHIHADSPEIADLAWLEIALADAFVALPGGLGTLEELFEVATLTQLAEHQKALACLNVRDFFVPLRNMLTHATAEGFMKIEHCDMLILEADPLKALEQIDQWQAPTVTKWIGQPGS
mgnify:CR=1 FL=1